MGETLGTENVLPHALRVFVSSRMEELAEERRIIRSVLTEAGIYSWVYEEDAGARPGSPRETYLRALAVSDVYLGVFWKTLGEYTADELDAARRAGVACLVYEKSASLPAGRDPALQSFLDRVGDVETGVSIRRFNSSDELADALRTDLTAVQDQLERMITTGGRSYTATPQGGRFDRVAASTAKRKAPLQRTNAPAPPRPFVDRVGPVGRLHSAIGAGERLVGVGGTPGIGKTSLLRAVAHDPGWPAERFSDGMGIHIEGDGLPLGGDALRRLWSELYRVADRRFVPDDIELRADLQTVEALVFIDGARFPADHTERLASTVPHSVFVLADGGEPGTLSHVKTIPLAGFEEPDDMLALFGATFGGDIPPAMREAVSELCRTAGGAPGDIVRLANAAWAAGDVARWLSEKEHATDPVARAVTDHRDEGDRRFLALLAAFGPDVTTPAEVVERLGVERERLDRLVASGDVLVGNPGYRLTGATYSVIIRSDDPAGRQEEVVAAAIAWAEEAPAERLRQSVGFLVRILDWAAAAPDDRGRVVTLARALAPQLAAAGVWDSWGEAIRHGLTAAQAAGDAGGTAWALHERGTRSLMLGDRRSARRDLKRARRMRKRLDDVQGEAVTTHNLRHTLGFWGRLTNRVGTGPTVIGAIVLAVVLVFGIGSVIAGPGPNGPVAREDRVEVTRGGSVTVDVLANDEGNRDLTAAVVTCPEHGSLEVDGEEIACPIQGEAELGEGTVTYHHDGSETAEDSFDYRISDGSATAEATVFVIISPSDEQTTTVTGAGNQAPTANDDEASTVSNNPVAIDVLANDTDPDGDPLFVVDASQPANGTITVDDGTITYQPNEGFAGDDRFEYVASDGTFDSNPALVVITVENQPPTANDDEASTVSNNPVAIDVLANDTDPDGDPLFVVDASQPANGTITVDDGTITYQPNEGFAGDDRFEYVASDGTFDSNPALVVITVENQPPTANDDEASTSEGSAVQVEVVANDTDPEGDPLVVASATDPLNGTVSFEGGTITYQPDDGFSGEDSFQYVASDGLADSNPATVTITVNQVVLGSLTPVPLAFRAG